MLHDWACIMRPYCDAFSIAGCCLSPCELTWGASCETCHIKLTSMYREAGPKTWFAIRSALSFPGRYRVLLLGRRRGEPNRVVAPLLQMKRCLVRAHECHSPYQLRRNIHILYSRITSLTSPSFMLRPPTFRSMSLLFPLFHWPSSSSPSSALDWSVACWAIAKLRLLNYGLPHKDWVDKFALEDGGGG